MPLNDTCHIPSIMLTIAPSCRMDAITLNESLKDDETLLVTFKITKQDVATFLCRDADFIGSVTLFTDDNNDTKKEVVQ